MANPLCKPIKSALVKIYGNKNVRVTNGKGTAWGWVHISLNVVKEASCFCNELQYEYCKVCMNTNWTSSQIVKAQAREILLANNLKPYAYCDDMGGDRDEILVNINLI